ncbi:MAG: ammonium transporter [Proteobacteria bacterium]|nr:ammonium transporter [Pseudomonadota bacterium]
MKLSALSGSRKNFLLLLSVIVAGLFLTPGDLFADGPTETIDKADTAWLLMSTAMVMFMTPGLALFYAGMARRKNVLGTMMHSYFLLSLITLQWILWGYSLSFGTDVGGIIGSTNYFGLNGVGTEALGTVPHLIFMGFQGMFAVITVALITGGVAERVKFSAILVFSVIWATVVYDPLCHWVWGGGWMSKLGVLDFAGGIVVHISCGIAALVAAIVVGKRRGWPKELMPPHNLTLTLMGMGILWFGWFGFNAGSALAADGSAAMAFINTNTAAAAGTLAWTAVEWKKNGKPTLLGAMSGTVAGLGSITPAAGFVTPMASIIIGLVGGSLCYYTVTILKMKLKYDDTLDVFGIHGIAGTWGTLATGIFASVGAKGLLEGNPHQLWVQFIAVVATIVFTAVLTYLILKLVDLTIGLRVDAEGEFEGLDLSQHGESGYIL